MLHSNLLASTVPLRDTSLPSPVTGSIRHSHCAPPPGLLSTNACLSSTETPTGPQDRPTNGALFSTRPQPSPSLRYTAFDPSFTTPTEYLPLPLWPTRNPPAPTPLAA